MAHGTGPRWQRLLPCCRRGSERAIISTDRVGILRHSAVRSSKRHLHVSWLPGLVVDDLGERGVENADSEQRLRDAENEVRAWWVAVYKAMRLPLLTYELVAIPARLAFPRTLLAAPAVIVIDVVADAFELVCVFEELRHARRRGKARAAEPADHVYTRTRLARDLLTVVVLHSGRAVYMLLSFPYVWWAAQLVRLGRVFDLMSYVHLMNGDLTTNVAFLATYKFSVFLFSVPHWVACLWWLLAEHGAGAKLALPSWSAQFELLADNSQFDPAEASDWQRYMLSLFMAWSGISAMGYGPLTLTKVNELAFAVLICIVQIVFYAFVLGTLFHYLVRVDSNTAHFKELLRAVDEYCAKRSLPPAVSKKIRSHFEFQHTKRSSSTETIFEQMPLSLKVKVASATHSRHVQGAWVFHGCNPQFLNQIVIVLKERYVMPLEVLFNQGEGSRELLWLTNGSLHVRKGDVHQSTLRSDLGDGQVVGELGFFLGIQQPFTVSATAAGDVTLLVITGADYDEIIGAYPEQADLIVANMLRKFGLDRQGTVVTDTGAGLGGALSEDEQEEFEALRAIIQQTIVEGNEEAITQMSYAASIGDVETVRALAAKGLDVNAGNYDRRTTLHLAAAEGNAKVVALLCELTANPSLTDRWGSTPLRDAIVSNHAEVASVLSAQGAELKLQRPCALLLEAVAQGSIARVQALLSHGVEINTVDYDGRSALHLASAEGDMRLVEFLMGALADVNLRDRWGNKPIDDALSNEHELVAHLHVQRGARANPLTVFNRLCTAASDGNVNLVRFLVHAGAPLHAADYDARTPLHLAVCAGSISTTHCLISALADVRAVDRWGATALIDALEHNSEVAALLVHQCSATLPPRYEPERILCALYRVAQSYDIATVLDKLRAREMHRTQTLTARQLTRRELELELKTLSRAMAELSVLQSRLFAQIERSADEWIGAYALHENLDETSSQDSLEEEAAEGEVAGALAEPSDESGTDSDGGSAPCSARGGAAALGGSVASLPARGSADGGGGCGTAQPAGGAPAACAGARAQHLAVKTKASATSAFLPLVLRLPRAEGGLTMLKHAFARTLAPAAHSALGDAQRRRAEEQALRGILRAECGFEDEALLEQVVDEIYDELRATLGPRAPRRASAADDAAAQGCEAQPPPPPQQPPPSAPAAARRNSKGGCCLSRGAAGVGSPTGSAAGTAAEPPASEVGGAAGGDNGQPLHLSQLGYRLVFFSGTFVRTLVHAASARHAGSAPASPASQPGWSLCASPLRSRREARRSAPQARVTPPPSPPGGGGGGAEQQQQLWPPAAGGREPRHSGARRTSRCAVGGWLRATAAVDPEAPPGTASPVGSSRSGRGGDAPPAESRASAVLDVRRHCPLGERAAAPAPGYTDRYTDRYSDRCKGAHEGCGGAGAGPGPKKLSGSGSSLSLATTTDEPSRGYRRRAATEGRVAPGCGPSAVDSSGRQHQRWKPMSASAGAGSAVAARIQRSAAEQLAAQRASSAALASHPDALVEAASVLHGLYCVFDSHGRGAVHWRDVRQLQTRLGELGGSEVRALMAHLIDAAAELHGPALAPTGGTALDPAGAAPASGRAEPRRGSRSRPCDLSAPMFYAGSASWVLASAEEVQQEEEAEARRALAEGGAPSEAVPPLLLLRTAHLSALSGGGPAAGGRPSPDARCGGGAPDGRAAPRLGDARDPAAADGAAEDQLARVLGSADALAALCTSLHARIDADKLKPTERVSAPTLAGIVAAALPEAAGGALSAHDIAAWYAARLKGVRLDVPNADDAVWRDAAAGVLGGSRGGAATRCSDSMGSYKSARSSAGDAAEPVGRRGAAPVQGEPVGAVEKEAVVQGGVARGGADTTWEQLCRALREAVGQMQREAAEALSHEAARATPSRRLLGRARRWLRGGAETAASTAVADGGGGSSAGGADDAEGEANLRPWYVVPHTSRAYLLFERLFLGLVAWDALQTPVHLCFAAEAERLAWVWHANFALDGYYLLRVGVRFCTSFVNSMSVTIYRPLEIRHHYLSRDFTLDLVAAWPNDLLALALGNRGLVVVALRCLKLINVRYVLRAYRAFERAKADDNLLVGLVQYNGLILLTAHVCACVWNVFATSALARLNEATWAGQFNANAAEVGGVTADDLVGAEADGGGAWGASPLQVLALRYLVSLFHCSSAITTLGAGQVPANYYELAFVLFMMLLNFTIYAFAVGKISALVMRQDDEIVTKRAQLELVNGYLQHVKVPSQLKAQIGAFFQARLRDASLSAVPDEQIYAQMPISLQIEVSQYTNRALVGECALFKGCSDGFVDRLSSLLRERTLEPETTLFRVSDICKELFIVEAGVVEVFGEGEGEGQAGAPPLELVQPGEPLGELPFVFGMRHVSNARSSHAQETKLFALTLERYRALLKAFPHQEDVIMDNAMRLQAQAGGGLSARSARSGKSKASARSGGPRSARSHNSGTDAASSHGGGGHGGGGARDAAEGQSTIQKIIASAKKKREDLHTVRLCGASAKGELDKVRQLLSTRAVDVNRGDYDGRRPLHVAACAGHTRVLELLIASGADVNATDRRGTTALHDALKHRQGPAAELLLRHGAQRLCAHIADALCAASARGDSLEELRYLVGFDASDVSAANYGARTPLHLAAAEGHVANARLLIEQGADVNAADWRGLTPLQEAFHGRHANMSTLLLRHGGHMGSFDAPVEFCAAAARNDVGTLQRLIEHVCDPNEGDYDGRTPLHLAASCGRVHAVHMLLDLPGIDMNVEDRYGNTPLDDAEREGCDEIEVVRTLLRSRGAGRGSGQPAKQGVTPDDAEEVKADTDVADVREHRRYMPKVRALKRWVSRQISATRHARKLIDDATALEREHGDVLTEMRPHLWERLKKVAAAHQPRRQHLLHTVQPAIARWHEKLDFASHMTSELQQRVSTLLQLQAVAARPLEALLEAKFEDVAREEQQTSAVRRTSTDESGADGHGVSRRRQSSAALENDTLMSEIGRQWSKEDANAKGRQEQPSAAGANSDAAGGDES